MNYEQFTGILRALLPAGLAYCVGRGWITQSDVGEIMTAAVAVSAAVWSIISNRTGKVAGTGGKQIGVTGGGAIGSAIVLGFLLLSGGNAHAQTVAPATNPPAQKPRPAAVVLKAPVVATPAPVVKCLQLYCAGFYLGGVVYGIGGNAAILQNGINNSIFAGGADIGLNAGWQYWDSKYFFAVDVDGMMESKNTAGVSHFAGNSGAAVGMVHFKLGGNLANLIVGAGTSPFAPPAQLATSIMASYIDVACTAFRKGGTQFCSGVGTQFWLANNLTLDVLYDYGTPTKNFDALQNVGAKIAYHF